MHKILLTTFLNTSVEKNFTQLVSYVRDFLCQSLFQVFRHQLNHLPLNPLHEICHPRNPNSITLLLSHITQCPNPGDLLIEEALKIMRSRMEIQQAEMKSWLEHRLEEIMAPLSKLRDSD